MTPHPEPRPDGTFGTRPDHLPEAPPGTTSDVGPEQPPEAGPAGAAGVRADRASEPRPEGAAGTRPDHPPEPGPAGAAGVQADSAPVPSPEVGAPSTPVHLPAGLPAWTLRVVAALACLAIALVLAANGIQGISLGLFAAISLAAVAVPASAAPALVIGFAAIAVVFAGDDPFRPSVLLLLVLFHLFHLVCAIAALTPSRSRLHLAALRAPARRFALTQVVVFALAGVAALLPSGGTEPVVEVVGLLAAAGLAAAAVVLMRPRS
jgi:hypothetical protein